MQTSGIKPDEIIRIEIKMLPRSFSRVKQHSPKDSLTKHEQLIYADFLESLGHHNSAKFFRS